MTTQTQDMMKVNTQQRNRTMIGIVIVIAIVGVLAIILLPNLFGSGLTDYSGLGQTRLPDGGFVIGNPNANVTLIEFADYSCPACQSYLPTMDRFFEEYVKTGKAKFEYRIFPTHGGETTRYMGQMVECFEEQKPGSFWVAKDLLFQSSMRGRYDETTARTVANQLGVDYSTALVCADDAQQVDMDVEFGRNLGVQSTPAVLVRYGDSTPQFITYNGQQFSRGGAPYEAIQAAVEAGI